MKKNDNINKTTSKNSRIRTKNIPIKLISQYNNNVLKKPEWMKIKLPSNFEKIRYVTSTLKKYNLHSVCEQALCPNLSECFNRGTATFMILGAICTRRCPFCAVSHGRPLSVNHDEPKQLAQAVCDMNINHVVITSVVRDDLKDRGAQHFSQCIQEIRRRKNITIEILVPDFKDMIIQSLKIISLHPPNIFNHNLENIPRLYKLVRPGANYERSLKLLKYFKKLNPNIPTKSGLMLGLGEKNQEIIDVMRDLLNHGVTILTVGQYLQPSSKHLPVQKYVTLDEFEKIKETALLMGFERVFCGPFVRSSYHADTQFK